MTGYFPGGSREGLERARQTQCFSRIIHLAKLNPNCHMNYSIIFTEISFSPETSSLVAHEILMRLNVFNKLLVLVVVSSAPIYTMPYMLLVY